MAPKAPPMMTPTAKSITLPRTAKVLNSSKNFFIIISPLFFRAQTLRTQRRNVRLSQNTWRKREVKLPLSRCKKTGYSLIRAAGVRGRPQREGAAMPVEYKHSRTPSPSTPFRGQNAWRKRREEESALSHSLEKPHKDSKGDLLSLRKKPAQRKNVQLS